MNLSSFYQTQTAVGIGSYRKVARTGYSDYARIDMNTDLSGSLKRDSKFVPISWLEIKDAKPFAPSRLDQPAEPIPGPRQANGESEEMLRKFKRAHNASGFNPEDGRMVNFWSMKRSYADLMKLSIWVEQSAQLVAIDVRELYRLVNVCFLPFLLYADADVLKVYKPEGWAAPLPAELQAILDQVYLKRISDSVGWGLFARQDLAANQSVGTYTGVVLESSQGGSYCMEYDKGKDGATLLVDAKYFGNQTRFVNHSEFGANMSVVAKAGSSDRMLMLDFVTQRSIQKDQQLFIDYGQNYWGLKQPQALSAV